MNILSINHLSDLLQTISPAPRLLILLAIGEGDACVCHLQAAFNWRQAYLSQHLMALRKAGILITRREGRNIHYQLKDPELILLIRQAARIHGLSLPELAPSSNCHCPNCQKKDYIS